MLKKYILMALSILSCVLGLAAHKRAIKDSAAIIITFNNNSNEDKPVDSVLVIFDKWDLSGAGIVKQVFYPVNNRIALVIPKGKYYVDVYCLTGRLKEHFGTVIKARLNKKNILFFKLKASELFMPGRVKFPEEKIDFANLSVTRYYSPK
jgi:hypothetical protein